MSSIVDDEYQRARCMFAVRVSELAVALNRFELLLPWLVGAGAGPVVATGDEDLVARRQQQLRAAEDVGAGAVGQRAVDVGRRIPDRVLEIAGLLARDVTAVAEHTAVGREGHVDRDHRPVPDGTELALDVRVGIDGRAHRQRQTLRSAIALGGGVSLRLGRGIATTAAGHQQQHGGQRGHDRAMKHRATPRSTPQWPQCHYKMR